MASFRSNSLALVLAALALGVPAEVAGQAAAAPPPAKSDAAAPPGPVLFRVILNDGTALASYGEFARVGDRVIFSMPIGEARSARLQAVNLPAGSVNWESTLRYAEAARYAQYVATRAETDFAMLTGEVAGALNEIRLASDPQRRLRLAEQTRRLLGGWPADHYAYRAKDVQEMSALLDETISQIRSSLGIHEFDFSLVASIDPPTMPLLPDPSLAQSIDQSLAAARASDVPAERMALFAAALTVIDESRGRLPKEWLSRARSAARDALEFEAKTSRKYAGLARDAMRSASEAAADGDVRSVERTIKKAQERDAKLGRRRGDEMNALMAALQERLDSARRLRLLRDRWSQRAEAFRAYTDALDGPLNLLDKLRRRLEDVRALAGPPVNALPEMIQRFERAYRQLRLVRPPDEMASAHATLLSAAELGQQAARTRERATMTGDVRLAWDASAAAAGSLMMLAQGRQQIEILSRPPELR